MEFSILINWTSPFSFEGMLGGNFQLYSNFDRIFCKQPVENLIRRRVLWLLICLCTGWLMAHKKETRLKWVNLACLNNSSVAQNGLILVVTSFKLAFMVKTLKNHLPLDH